MPFALSDNRKIHYQVEGRGPSLLLHHGFTSSLEAWRFFGFTAVLREHYQVIQFDALGHGQSDKPHDPAAYTQVQRCRDALAVLDAVGIERTHFFGYSLGGWVGYGLVRHAPERLHSLILGAAHPYEDRSWDGFHGIDGRDPEAFIATFEGLLDEQISAQVKMLIRANDLEALAAAAQQPRPSQEDLLARMDLPCLLFCGDADARHAAVQRTAALLPQGEFVSLPGVTHFGGLMQSALVLPPVLSFLAQRQR
ncbi:esterase lipase superfamily protein [Herbaspirillum sp. GW103]|uniref:alpha/beta fold hydrolase n=1 Tax=unclassified Herbaspirillum TaxID=2624150 RepID=UPI00025E268B|nr:MULTISPECIES: alpha/beta hydrolase [unclassified Herbaspirillum]EIJ46911.1 esterase lipase superfamily protein [Herbaspirillum sp. GW103]MCI1003979.1 alpha/beta fold hydrolase [Herbaspirillum sp. C7C8]